MNITVEMLKKKFVVYNDRYFGGKLKMPTFVITNTRRRLGCCHAIANKIEISNYWNRTEKEFDTTLIHEMIHAWQWMVYENVDHGTTFKRKAEMINRDGWTISRITTFNAVPNKIKKAEETDIYILPAAGNKFDVGKVNKKYLGSIVENVFKYHKYKTYYHVKTTSVEVLGMRDSRTYFHYMTLTKEQILDKFGIDITKAKVIEIN